MYIHIVDAVSGARRNFQWWMQSHRSIPYFHFCRVTRRPRAIGVPAAFALYDDKDEGQANWGCSQAPVGCHSCRGAQNPGTAANPLDRRGRLWPNPHGGRPGRFVSACRFAGAKEADESLEPFAGSESSYWLRGDVPLSRNGRGRAGLRSHAFGISLRAGIVELPGDSGATRCPEEIESHAGFALLRRSRLRPPAPAGASLTLGRGTEPTFHRLREEPVDRDTHDLAAEGGRLGTSYRQKK